MNKLCVGEMASWCRLVVPLSDPTVNHQRGEDATKKCADYYYVLLN